MVYNWNVKYDGDIGTRLWSPNAIFLDDYWIDFGFQAGKTHLHGLEYLFSWFSCQVGHVGWMSGAQKNNFRHCVCVSKWVNSNWVLPSLFVKLVRHRSHSTSRLPPLASRLRISTQTETKPQLTWSSRRERAPRGLKLAKRTSSCRERASDVKVGASDSQNPISL